MVFAASDAADGWEKLGRRAPGAHQRMLAAVAHRSPSSGQTTAPSQSTALAPSGRWQAAPAMAVRSDWRRPAVVLP